MRLARNKQPPGEEGLRWELSSDSRWKIGSPTAGGRSLPTSRRPSSSFRLSVSSGTSSSRLTIRQSARANRRAVLAAAAPANPDPPRPEAAGPMISWITNSRHRGSIRLRCDGALAVLALVFSGCYGDFGRPRPSVLTESRPYWVGAEAANTLGVP